MTKLCTIIVHSVLGLEILSKHHCTCHDISYIFYYKTNGRLSRIVTVPFYPPHTVFPHSIAAMEGLTCYNTEQGVPCHASLLQHKAPHCCKSLNRCLLPAHKFVAIGLIAMCNISFERSLESDSDESNF